MWADMSWSNLSMNLNYKMASWLCNATQQTLPSLDNIAMWNSCSDYNDTKLNEFCSLCHKYKAGLSHILCSCPYYFNADKSVEPEVTLDTSQDGTNHKYNRVTWSMMRY